MPWPLFRALVLAESVLVLTKNLKKVQDLRCSYKLRQFWLQMKNLTFLSEVDLENARENGVRHWEQIRLWEIDARPSSCNTLCGRQSNQTSSNLQCRQSFHSVSFFLSMLLFIFPSLVSLKLVYLHPSISSFNYNFLSFSSFLLFRLGFYFSFFLLFHLCFYFIFVSN